MLSFFTACTSLNLREVIIERMVVLRLFHAFFVRFGM